MEKSEGHYHPLSTSEFCCAVHVHELLIIFIQQKKEIEILSVLLNFSYQMQTSFLLDNSNANIELKLKLGKICNKFALNQRLDFTNMEILLETCFNLYSSLPETQEYLGYLATASSNLAFLAKNEGDYDKACRYLEQSSSIEKQIQDSTGDLMTKINKAAVYNEMEAYQKALDIIRSPVSKLEKKINSMQNQKQDSNLRGSKKFIETLQLLLISYINLVTALENMQDPDCNAEAEAKKTLGFQLCQRFLGENYHLNRYFQSYKPYSLKNLSNLISDYDVVSNKSIIDSDKSILISNESSLDITSNKVPIKPLILNPSMSEPVINKINYSSQSESLKSDKSKSKILEKPKISSRKIIAAGKTTPKSPDFFQNIGKIEPENPLLKSEPKIQTEKILPKTDLKIKPNKIISNAEPSKIVPKSEPKAELDKMVSKSEPKTGPDRIIHKTESKTQPKTMHAEVEMKLNFTRSITLGMVPESSTRSVKVIRVPGNNLPFIPVRCCSYQNSYKFNFPQLQLPRTYEYLLDPLKSPILNQLNVEIGTVKFLDHSDRLIMCSLVLENNIINLSIIATTQDSKDHYLISEYTKINDLKSILSYLCILDLLPSYMLPGFINSFEKFCKFYLMPFIRIVEIEETSTENIELWARAESLLPQDTKQVFLNTMCSVSLYYIENLNLRLVIANILDEESSDKSLRLDIRLDESSSEILIKYYPQPVINKEFIYIPSIEPFDPKFIEELDSIISEIELCIKDEFGPVVTFDEFIDKNNFLLVRANISGEKLDKTLWVLEDQRSKLCWNIKVKKLHKLNSSRHKRNFIYQFNYSYFKIYSIYGVKVDKISKRESSILAYFILESYKIDESMEKEFEENENETISEDCFIVFQLKSLKSIRKFIGNQYRIPITLSIVGINTHLIGIKASIFDIETCIENSCWFLLDGNFYMQKQFKSKKIGRFNDGILNKLLSESRLIEILEKQKGWDKVMNALNFEKNCLRIHSVGGFSYIESLENIIIRSDM